MTGAVDGRGADPPGVLRAGAGPSLPASRIKIGTFILVLEGRPGTRLELEHRQRCSPGCPATAGRSC